MYLLFFQVDFDINDIVNYILNYFSSKPLLASIIIGVLVFVYFVLKYLPKLKDLVESIEFFKVRIKKEENHPATVTSELIDHSKRIPITNSSNKYVENEHNVNKLTKLLRSNKNRIIVVSGEAGIGKTKLVEYVCTTLLNDEFVNQIYMDFENVNSKDIRKPTDTTNDILKYTKITIVNTALGAKERIKNYGVIAKDYQRPTIIFIDNYEQVLDNSELSLKIFSEIINPLVDNNELIKVVITSRTNLDEACVNFKVEPLSNIPLHEFGDFEGDLTKEYTAIKLFCKLYNQDSLTDDLDYKNDKFSKEQFRIIVELCHRVSNLPLGIHLIATSSSHSEISFEDIQSDLKFHFNKPIPNLFREFSNRHKSLYNVFDWTYGQLSKTEKEFYKHLMYFPNGFFINNLPHWEGFINRSETKQKVIILNKRSFLRDQKYHPRLRNRYEIIILFRELLGINEENSRDKFSKDYVHAIHLAAYKRLQEIDEFIHGKNSIMADVDLLKEEIRLEYENITYFIEQSSDTHIQLAIDMLVCLERILNEFGPYILLEDIYNPLLDKTNDQEQRARLLMSKARVIKSTEQRENSLPLIEEAIKLLEKTNIKSELLGEAYRIGTYLSSQIGDNKLTQSILAKIDKFTESDKVKLGQLNMAFITLEQARKYERNGEMLNAITHFERTIKLMEGYKVQQAQAYNFAGMFYWRYGSSEKSERYFLEAIKKYNGIGEDRWILGFNTNLGLLYCDQDKLDKSLHYTEKVSEALKVQGPFGWSMINLLSLGRIYCRKNESPENFKVAEQYLLISFRKLRDIKYVESVLLASAELVELYYKYGMYDKARVYCDKSILYAKNNSYDSYMRYFRVICILGLINSKEGKIKESLINFEEAKNLVGRIEGNGWLSYKLTKQRFDSLKKVHSK
ncbi:AAA family ATPase [Tamlana sp. 62-3]|uniref:AAA family ATPase n=1 Tax=Neotamlana sargassicola TaxID=2883125 RepID=A0A9X1I859_9FLAO|nr:tetratricopeptide repeat protein [Tamlana sargassicola]MCB4808574.1 AAA family ATPase [Tamlana sargassicola]